MIFYHVIKMAQIDFVENGLHGSNHGSRKTRKEVIVMATARDDGSLLIYNTRIMVAMTVWHCWENEIR